jgi:hypothetical protein
LHLLNFGELPASFSGETVQLPVQMDTTLEFPSSSPTPWCGGLLDSDVGCVISPTLATPPQLR